MFALPARAKRLQWKMTLRDGLHPSQRSSRVGGISAKESHDLSLNLAPT